MEATPMPGRLPYPLLFVTLVLFTACGDAPVPDDTPEGRESAGTAEAGTPPAPFQLSERQASGKLVWDNLCWTCHGEAGRADGPAVVAGSVPAPPDFHVGGFAALTADELEVRFRSALEGGEADPDHPHMRFVASLVRPELFRDALAYVPALTWPREIPGSAVAGRETYRELCVGCHGATGRGDGPAASLMVVAPADLAADTLVARGDFQAVFDRIERGGGTVHGSSMPAWGVMLDAEAIWDLVAYVASFQPDVLDAPPADEP